MRGITVPVVITVYTDRSFSSDQEPAGRRAAQAGRRHSDGEEEGRRGHPRRGEDQDDRQVQGLQGDAGPGARDRQEEDSTTSMPATWTTPSASSPAPPAAWASPSRLNTLPVAAHRNRPPPNLAGAVSICRCGFCEPIRESTMAKKQSTDAAPAADPAAATPSPPAAPEGKAPDGKVPDGKAKEKAKKPPADRRLSKRRRPQQRRRPRSPRRRQAGRSDRRSREQEERPSRRQRRAAARSCATSSRTCSRRSPRKARRR